MVAATFILCSARAATELPAAPGDPVAIGKTRVGAKDGQTYVWINPGEFVMGCSDGDDMCHAEERPPHRVRISRGFWLGQTVVTAGTWKRYRLATDKPALPTSDPHGRTGLNEAGPAEVPAVLMNWEEAREFCAWAGGRLPTEAEWEYAARAGIPAAHPSGDLSDIAWFGNNSGLRPLDTAALYAQDKDGSLIDKTLLENDNRPRAVRQKRPNPWSLYDMFGSVSQWLADWFDRRYYAHSVTVNPLGPSQPEKDFPQRVIRGNSWDGPPDDTRVSRRGRIPPSDRYSAVGLRCVQLNR